MQNTNLNNSPLAPHLTDSAENKAKEPSVNLNVLPRSHSLHLTDSAANKVKELIEEEDNDQLKLRAYVTGGGCSGFQYGFTFDEVMDEDDVSVEKNGVLLIVDPVSYQYLEGAEIDYVDDLQGSRFIIRNPKAKTTCGCGSSFSVGEPDALEEPDNKDET